MGLLFAHESAFGVFSTRAGMAVEVRGFGVVAGAAFAACSGRDFSESAGPFPD